MYKTERTSELEQGKGDRNRYPHGSPVLLWRAWDKGRGALSGVQSLLEYARDRRDRCLHGKL